MKRAKWILIYGVLLYFIWSILLFCSPEPMNTTVMGIFRENGISNIVMAVMFLLSSILTFIGLFFKNSVMSLIFCFPQQILLLLNSLSCLICIFRQEYSDGVTRPFAFILTDQLPFILLSIVHFLALLDMCLFSHVTDRINN